MKGVSDYVVVYDITDDGERRRVDKVLKGYGFRAQKSVFECRLSRKMKDDMVKDLRYLGIKTGNIKIYRLEHSLEPPVIGEGGTTMIDDGPAFIV